MCSVKACRLAMIQAGFPNLTPRSEDRRTDKTIKAAWYKAYHSWALHLPRQFRSALIFGKHAFHAFGQVPRLFRFGIHRLEEYFHDPRVMMPRPEERKPINFIQPVLHDFQSVTCNRGKINIVQPSRAWGGGETLRLWRSANCLPRVPQVLGGSDMLSARFSCSPLPTRDNCIPNFMAER